MLRWSYISFMQEATEMQKRMGKLLLLFPLPFQGHQPPMLQLANILYAKGFSICIIHTTFNAPNPANYPHFKFHSIPDSSIGCEADIKDVITLLNRLNVLYVECFRDLLVHILNDAAESPVCLIADCLWHFTQDVADSLRLPRIVLRTSNASSLYAFTYSSVFRDKGYLSAKGCQLEAQVPELPPLKMKDIPMHGTRDPEATYELVSNMMEKMKASRGLILNTFEELEGPSLAKIQKEIQIPVYAVGPFHKQVSVSSSSLIVQDRSCISWLDAQRSKSVIYVSFGSIAALAEQEFIEVAWGLANSKQPFLWVIRPGLVRTTNGTAALPDAFKETVAERGRIVTWAPQEEVLAHPATGIFWTHNGWNSTLESICAGVPMLCFPCFGDQMVNARYVCDVWRVGLRFEHELKRGDIEKEIRRLMLENEGKQMRQRISYLKDKASLCIATGGSSYNSLENLVAQILSF